MAGVMAGLFFLLSILAFCYLFDRVTRMLLDHRYRMMILQHNQDRDMTLVRNEHQRQLAEIAPPPAQVKIPMARIAIRFTREVRPSSDIADVVIHTDDQERR